MEDFDEPFAIELIKEILGKVLDKYNVREMEIGMKIKGGKVTDTHVYFWGGEFSNFYKCEFTWKGHKFTTSEQAFMWAKAMKFGDEEIAKKILSYRDPKKAKSLGRKVRGYDDQEWSKVRYDIMVEINVEKYSQNRRLLKALLETGDRTLVEGSPLDEIWGVGLHYDDDQITEDSNWRGLNLLGKALMEVRAKLM